MRWLTTVSETTTSHPANSPWSWSMRPARPAMFVPTSGKSSTSSFARLDRVDDDGQRVVVHRHELGGVLAGRPVLAQDDRDDVADEADDVLARPSGRRIRCSMYRNRRRPHRHAVDVGAGEDLHVREAPPPPRCRPPLMRACANGERTNVTVSAPSSGMFSMYVPSPRRKRGSSLPQHAVAEDAHRAASLTDPLE